MSRPEVPASPGAPVKRSVVIHGHFYQPPREDPWLEEVEREPGAAPFHDWNERIDRECYRAVVAARIPGREGRIARVVNTLEHISFNVGPTLADWLEPSAPETWRAMLAADRASALRLGGHGNAIAMPYHHLILPLASRRDKRTEVRWGNADFRRRFGREPEGMWLPETAVDDETLDVLAEEGIRFTVLAPHQVTEPPPHGHPGRYRTASGREIALFPYDGGLSHDLAFGPLTKDGMLWTRRMLAAHPESRGPLLVSMATDGETFGHHHRFGEMALAAALDRLHGTTGVRVENFASFLARHPATAPVELVAPSAWSCPHGVERWRSDCGCRIRAGTSQAWRAPLRDALDWLAGELHSRYEAEAGRLVPDPWAAWDGYSQHDPAPGRRPVRLAELLEMERDALRMFTSCGWFFDDIADIGTVICLRYAARAIALAGPEHAPALEAGLRTRLAAAASNDESQGSGRDVYDAGARPSHPGHIRAAAGFAAASSVTGAPLRPVVGAYRVEPSDPGLLVRHLPTGRVWQAATTVRQPAHGTVVTDVTTDHTASTAVELEQLPEPEADAVRRVLRRAGRSGILTSEDEQRILDAGVPYARVLADALVRQLPADPAQANGIDLERLERTLDLLLVEGHHVPFDAQTRYYRLMQEGPAALRGRLGPLAERFGFTAETFATPR